MFDKFGRLSFSADEPPASRFTVDGDLVEWRSIEKRQTAVPSRSLSPGKVALTRSDDAVQNAADAANTQFLLF
jgi:hypothetical protein